MNHVQPNRPWTSLDIAGMIRAVVIAASQKKNVSLEFYRGVLYCAAALYLIFAKENQKESEWVEGIVK